MVRFLWSNEGFMIQAVQRFLLYLRGASSLGSFDNFPLSATPGEHVYPNNDVSAAHQHASGGEQHHLFPQHDNGYMQYGRSHHERSE